MSSRENVGGAATGREREREGGGVSEARARAIARHIAREEARPIAREEARSIAREEARTEAARQVANLDVRNSFASMMSSLVWQTTVREEVTRQAQNVVPALVRERAAAVVPEIAKSTCVEVVPTMVGEHLRDSRAARRAAEQMTEVFRRQQEQRLAEMLAQSSSTLMGPYMREMRRQYAGEFQKMKTEHADAVAEAVAKVEEKFSADVSDARRIATTSAAVAFVSLASTIFSKL